MADLIQFRGGSAALWTSVNPTPAQGEPCYEEDTGRIKYGNGTTAWTSLPYATGPGTPISRQAGTAYTLALLDANTTIEFTSDSAITLSIPDHSVVPFPVGTTINARGLGQGLVLIQGVSLAVIVSPAGSTTRVQNATVTLECNGVDSWVLGGDLADA